MSQFWVNVTPAVGDLQTLTPDTGGIINPSGGTIQVLGQQAGTVPTVQTYNGGTNILRVADQTWETQYVVDSSTTEGLKGTFQTIQAAINQAVTDGMSNINPKRIFIRYNGGNTYSENLTLYPGLILEGVSIADADFALKVPSITGNHTCVDNVIISLIGLTFVNTHATSNTFTAGTSFIVFAEDCQFSITTGTGLHFNVTGSGSKFTQCNFDQTIFQNGISFSSLTLGYFYNCNFNSTGILNSGVVTLRDCFTCGPITCTNASVIAYGTSFGSAGANISGTGSGGQLYDCTFNSNSSTAVAITHTGTWYIRNIGKAGGASGPRDLYLPSDQANAATVLPQCLAGNVYRSMRQNVSYVVGSSDFYIGITSTSAPRTVSLPVTGVCLDRVYIIKDESGGAAANNITVTCVGGVVLIDGATTYPINTNYGSITLIWSGSQYFIL